MPENQNRGKGGVGSLSPWVLWKYRNNLPELFEVLAQRTDDVITFNVFPGKKRFLLRHPDAVREVLVTQADRFSKGPSFLWLRNVVGNSLLVSEGDYHRSQYQLMVSFFKRASLASYQQAMVEATTEMMSSWRDGTTLDVSVAMHRLALRILAVTLFGQDPGSRCDEILDAAREVGRQPQYLSRRLFPLNRCINALPLPENIRLRRAVGVLDDIVYGWIEARRQEERNTDDLLTSLIRSAGPNPDHAALARIRDEVVGFLIVGHETISSGLEWAWYCLSEFPEVEKAFHGELDQASAGMPGSDSLSGVNGEDLPFTQAFFTEVLRLYPPSYAMTRVAEQDVQIGDLSVPRGSLLTLSPFITHRDARFFARPLAFDPGRWLSSETSSAQRGAYFPFGAGARQCIGANFAKQEATLILATIGRRWRLTRASSDPVEFDAGLSLGVKNGLKLKLVSRFSSSPP